MGGVRVNGRGRFIIGLVVVLAVLIAGGVFVIWNNGRPRPPADVTISCVGGSEKSGLMADPEVQALLKESYGITVQWQSMGSYDQVLLPSAEITKRGYDCLWPSSASALGVFTDRHAGEFPGWRAETLLQSPLVVYAGPQGTDALVANKLVTRRDDRYYLVDMQGLLLDQILKGRTWADLKAGNLRGPINVSSTDPVKSNSGFTLSQLELTIVATQNVDRPPTLAETRTALPTMRTIYDGQGLQATSSDNGFRQWLTQGGEYAAPLYAGYENQITQAYVSSRNSANLLKQVRILYPEPTIYSDHPMIALNPEAGRLVEAMKDERIQRLAWKKYGFRSAVNAEYNDVADFPDVPLAAQFRTIPAPSGEVTLALLGCLTDRGRCS